MSHVLKDLNVFLPIQRSFESKGKRYIYGYAAIFNEADAHGTFLSREVVEKNLARLREYPALRFQHRTPLGQIVFNDEIEGIKTSIDSQGFHILAEVYPSCEKEWTMIKQGKFGLSYALHNPKLEQRQHNGIAVPTFTDGLLYEVSVVDTPSCTACDLNTITRSYTFRPNPSIAERIRDLFNPLEERIIAMETKVAADNRKSPKSPKRLRHKITRSLNPNDEREMATELRPIKGTENYPEICTKECPHTQCSSWGVPSMQGQPCRNRVEVNRGFMAERSLNPNLRV